MSRGGEFQHVSSVPGFNVEFKYTFDFPGNNFIAFFPPNISIG